MGVGVKANFNLAQLKRDLYQDGIDQMKQGVIDVFSEAGKGFANRARMNASFQNRTWNLRSSIGYAVGSEGNIVDEFFESLGGGTDGAQVGAEIAREQMPKNGVALVVVAGEYYAVYVEWYGFDVLSFESAETERILKEALGD